MNNYWIFKVNDQLVDGEPIIGIEVYNKRMKDNFWGLPEDTRNLSHLQIGDKIIFYLAGDGGQKFLGTASLGSTLHILTAEEGKRLWHNKFFQAKQGVMLKQVDVWPTAISILPMIKTGMLSFIKNKENWGAYLQGSIQPISPQDYNKIIEPKSDNEEKEQTSNVIYGTLRVIEEKNEIDEAQTLFERTLKNAADRTEMIWVGFQGGNLHLEASWNKRLNIWWINSTADGNRYWNAFGIGEPQWGSTFSHNIICEINPPFEGINRYMAGVYAKDSAGKLYLLHRGKIGGGKPGNSKSKFEKEYRGNWIYAQDGDRLTKLALIASFESPRFVDQVADFVNQVNSIKSGQQTSTSFDIKGVNLQDPSFSKEFEGKKTYSVNREIEAACDHGIITNSLEDILKKRGSTVGSNHQIDLYTETKGNLTALFEIKTDTSSTNIYGAIGQLLYHSTSIGKPCKLISVFPENIDINSKNIFKKLNIELVTYSWVDGKPVFRFLEELLSKIPS
jgi:hypothetical protein